MTVTTYWQAPGCDWLQAKANRAYAVWLQSRDGKRYTAAKRRRGSPYKYGFTLPQWHHDAIDALNRDEEETFKAIKLANL